MVSRSLFAAGVATLALALPGSAFAGTVTLHPNGFGEKSYASWKAGEGQPDSKGNDDQALYFQKLVPTPVFAAAVARFNGIEGTPANGLRVGYDVRADGHCGAGAPRYNVGIQPPTGPGYTLFVGCAEMPVTGLASDDQGRPWLKKDVTIVAPPGSTVTSLLIVFDEGIEQGGFVHLDNIRVGGRTWTSANDNGN